MTNPDNYIDDIDKILRWIFNKPIHEKPEIGEQICFC